MKLDDLYQAAKSVQKMAYAPYSDFQVGAAIKDEFGNIHIGCNVENAAYPIGCCAEQSAVSQMRAQGGQQIKHILVVGREGQPCPPCGACRQIILEHGDQKTQVHLETEGGSFQSFAIRELLPMAFGQSHLDK